MSKSGRSNLQLQMGQETIYLLLTVAIFAALVLAAFVAQQKSREDPPIITLSEADGYYFAPGSSALTPQFSEQLRKITPTLAELAKRYDAKVVEVIGHTDEVPLNRTGRGGGDLDRNLIPYFGGNRTAMPIAADNVGLGMSRAVSVAKALRAGGLDDSFIIIPLSAGAFLKPDDTVAMGDDTGADEQRRRIEIRLRRSARSR